MLKLSTSQKIFLASILSKFLVFFFGSEKKLIKRNGINYKIDLNEGVDLGIFLNIKLEGKISNLMKLLGHTKKLNFIDVGANIGSVTLPLAKIFDKSSIFSIEPTYYAYEKLLKNTNLNPILKKRIKTFNFLINNDKKTRKVYSSWNLNSKGKKHKIYLDSLKKINEKNIISLDKFIKKINKKIDFIKIDVDGFELKVLKSGIKYIKKFKPIIHIEFAPYLHSGSNNSSESLIFFIKNKLGYDFYNEDFKKIKEINSYVKKIKKRSENFFLVNKKDIKNLQKLKS